MLHGIPQPTEHGGIARRRGDTAAAPFGRVREGHVAGVDDSHARAVVDPGARAGRRHQPLQHRPDAARIDGELERRRSLLGRDGGRLARRGLQQLLGIHRDRGVVGAGGSADGGRDDLALGLQALHAGVDEALAELVDVEEQHQQGREPAEVQHDDAARERRRQPHRDAAQRHAGPQPDRAADPAGAAAPRRPALQPTVGARPAER